MDNDEFLELKRFWYEQLKLTGFTDIENQKQELKRQDARAKRFLDPAQTQRFFIELEHFLTNTTTLKPMERSILTLYSQGVYLRVISIRVDRSYSYVKNCIRNYRRSCGL